MKDFEQSLANAADAGGNVSDASVMDLLSEAMSVGESWAAPQQPGEPDASAPAPAPAPAPAAAPVQAPAPAAPAPAPAAPATEPAQAPAPAPADPAATPVLLAKDGVHTIDYSKLTEARQEAANARAEATRLAAELAEARRTPATPAPAPAAPAAAPAPAVDLEGPLFGDYTDDDLKKGVQALLDKQAAALRAEFEGKLKPVEIDREVQARNAHLGTILAAHPDAHSIVESQEFEAWKATQPSFVRSAIEATQKQGTADEMVDVLNSYRNAHPRQAAAPAPAPVAAPAAPAAAPAPNAAALAAQAIAGAKERTPTTLSDIPAGGQAPTDEATAVAQQSPTDLMAKLQDMSPEQIEAYVSRFV